jgi:methylphosphotriester-DNA--protein-cysteine methyltransferase
MKKITYPCVEDHLNGLKGFDMYAMQLSSGKFLCQQRDLQLSKIVIGDRYISTSIQYHSILQQDCVYILIPNPQNDILVNGKINHLNQALFFTQKQEMLIRVPENYYAFYIIIPTIELIKYFDLASIEYFKKLIWQQNFSNTPFQKPNDSFKYLGSLIDNLLSRKKDLSHQAILDCQERIIESVCNMLRDCSKTPKVKKINMSTRLAIVDRALQYIHSNSRVHVTIPELAKVSYTCVRNLEYAFKSILFISPKQYLIKRRLQLIHLMIKDQGNLAIADIMNQFGIVNQGRFAQDYFKFFKEYPHQTRDRVSFFEKNQRHTLR